MKKKKILFSLVAVSYTIGTGYFTSSKYYKLTKKQKRKQLC